jgi:UDP:flavonoid glycosyltransferase YjiC (YdhE family)
MTSLAAGVPQVAVTFAGEQAANGERVAATGAGRHVPGATLTADALTEAVTALLTDERAVGAAADLKAQCASRPAPTDLIRTLAALRTPAGSSLVIR